MWDNINSIWKEKTTENKKNKIKTGRMSKVFSYLVVKIKIEIIFLKKG